MISLGARYQLLMPTRASRDLALQFLCGITHQSPIPALRALREACAGKVAIAFEHGGLLQWLDAWQNTVLPADFHAAESVRQARRRARGILAALGQDPDVLADKAADELSLLETRLVGFVKAMLLEPQLLVLDGLFERLGFEEAREVRRWIDYCTERYPFRRMLYLGLSEVAPELLAGFSPLDMKETA